MYIDVSTSVHVDDIMDQLDTDDLLDELRKRGRDYNTQYVDGDEMRELLEKIYINRRNGKDYQRELDSLIYGILGKIV
jgi:hypothetical protein